MPRKIYKTKAAVKKAKKKGQDYYKVKGGWSLTKVRRKKCGKRKAKSRR